MRAAGAILALAAVVLVVWGIGLIVKTTTGGTPDSSTSALVAVGIVLVLGGLALGAAAVLTARR